METFCSLLTIVIFLHTVTGSFINVAKGKPAAASSLYNKNFSASEAVDGNLRTILHTAVDQNFAWFTVDLQREVQDAEVEIFFRKNYVFRRNGVQLYTSTVSMVFYPEGQLCHTVTGNRNGSDIPDVYPVTCAGRWRYLLLYTNTSNDRSGPILDFREVKVIVCAENLYGPNCSLPCSGRKCINDSTPCHHVTGRCDSGCQLGYKEPDCRHVCVLGVNYGVNCSKSCSARHCMTSSSLPPDCDQQIGLCPDGCESGWTGGDCSINIQNLLSRSTFIGALVGTFFAALLIFGGVLACLIKLGRLRWVRSPGDTNADHVSRDVTYMNSIVSGHAQTDGQVHNNYDVLDTEQMHGNVTYDVIEHKE